MKKVSVSLLLLVGLLWFYSNSLIGINPKAKIYLKTLEKELIKEGYAPN